MKNLLIYFIFISLAVGFLSCEKEISTSPPTTPVPIAYIYIDSNPRGAMIYADGRISGKTTPDSLNWLEEKTYYFTLKKDLYRDTSFSVVIKKDERKEIFIDYLQNPKMYGKIFFNTIPDSANIFFDGDSTEFTTPYTLSGIIPGNYHIIFKKKNCITDSIDITVRSNKTTDAFRPLIDTTYWVEYSSSNSRFPMDQLTSIVTDKKGLIWIGTNGGLFSFNGEEWTEYNTLNSGIVSNFIKVIKVDADNNKWIGTPYGLNKFNGKVWTTYTTYRFQLPHNYISNILINDNDIYVCTNKGLVKKHFNKWELLFEQPCNGFAIDAKGIMWIIIKNHGIAHYEEPIGIYGGLWRFHYTKNNSNYNCIIADSEELWCGHINSSFGYYGLSSIPMDQDFIRRKRYPAFDNLTVNKIVLNNNEKWLCTDQGLYVFTTYPNVKRYWAGNTPLRSNNIAGVAFDNNGNAWVATFYTGLYKFKVPWH